MDWGARKGAVIAIQGSRDGHVPGSLACLRVMRSCVPKDFDKYREPLAQGAHRIDRCSLEREDGLEQRGRVIAGGWRFVVLLHHGTGVLAQVAVRVNMPSARRN